MTASDTKTVVVVVGGTGKVGGSTARSLHANPAFHVKVTTRDLTSDKAKRIGDAGIELVKADSWKIDELREAFKGANAVYLNIDSEAVEFAGNAPRPESQMGKLVIDAAREQGVSYFVFAGLPEAAKVTNDGVHITSFVQKNEISRYGQAAGFKSFVNVNVGWKMENWWDVVYEDAWGGFARKKDDEGYLTMKVFPMGNPPKPTPFTSVRDDYGDIVHGVFLDPQRWNNQTIWAVSDAATLQDTVDAYNRVTGTDVARWVPPTVAAQAGSEEKTKEIAGFGRYVELVNGLYCNGKPIDQTAARELKKSGAAARGLSGPEVELQTIEGFIRAHAFKGEDM